MHKKNIDTDAEYRKEMLRDINRKIETIGYPQKKYPYTSKGYSLDFLHSD